MYALVLPLSLPLLLPDQYKENSLMSEWQHCVLEFKRVTECEQYFYISVQRKYKYKYHEYIRIIISF